MESAVRETLAAIGLPAALPVARPAEELLSTIASDKKKRGGALHLVVPFAFGDVRVLGDVPNDAVRAAWRAVGAG
jgi:3-dehydroquinate synthetase